MRYDTSVHMILNESIRQINSKENVISMMESIINDIFHRADVLLESEEFFIEFYADNKNKFNSMLNEGIMNEEEFNKILYPLIVEGLWSRIMGEKLPTDEFRAKIDAIHDLANQSYIGSKQGNTDLQQRAETFRSRMINNLKQQYMEKAKNQGGLRGFGRKFMDRIGGSSVFRALGTKPYTELELDGNYSDPEEASKIKHEVKNKLLSGARDRLRKNHIQNPTHPTFEINPSRPEQKQLFNEPDPTTTSEPRRKNILPFSVGLKLRTDVEEDKKAKEKSGGKRGRGGRFIRQPEPPLTGGQGQLFPS